ncbi:type I-E CRISPR-associated protein Cse1/CasA [Streptomyces lichenis]|uniref:Type I-E CRISPR-associated protein Cse1/CasA n=1 Tax=Streptomyces lichenis TaxID=2306967 RepID=A0ABT0IAL9_9ACTN|nr:type I-E CRISPR-associated protein Cse1/CasA [Streptomyces lichenis]MCK8678372.1 type I-E CRISPR-associated protein Cse1/CasA [Streptomyces lichenis]
MPALTAKGEDIHFSLLDVLRRADELHAPLCTTPGEAVALIEYLLAICFAAEDYPASPDEWCTWVIEGHPFDKAVEWLADGAPGDWDLFHRDTPLGQNSQLRCKMDVEGTGPAQLILERVGDYSQFFDHHHLEDPTPIPAAEAFRALLVQHVYGLAGRARLSGKWLGPKLTNLAAGRLQSRIRVVAQGNTLGETLRLNLYPAAGGEVGRFNHSWTSAIFSRRGFQTKPPGRVTSGPADLHSCLGRSVLLEPVTAANGKDVLVTRVLIGAGEILELDPERDFEDAVSKQKVNGHGRPLWPSPTRALWRDAHALYTAATKEEKGLFGRLRTLAARTGDGLGGGSPYTLWAVGLLADKTLVTTWTDGYFPYAPSQEIELCWASQHGSAVAERIADGLERAAYAAWKIVYPNPKPADRPAQQARFDARREFWPAAEQPFLYLLEETALGAPAAQALPDYTAELRLLAEDFLKHRLDSLPANDTGMRARARAEQRFREWLAAPGAPVELRGGSG